MQLDQTHVVIRLRKFTEIGDLSLIMIRRYPEALLVGFGAGAIGWAITNMILLGWIPWEESLYGLDDEAAFVAATSVRTLMVAIPIFLKHLCKVFSYFGFKIN